MNERVDVSETPVSLLKLRNVHEFARRYRIEPQEEKRLLDLFGQFASEHELLMNARRQAVFR